MTTFVEQVKVTGQDCCKSPNFCSVGDTPRFAGHFRLQKSVAKGHYFATIFATVGSGGYEHRLRAGVHP